MSVTLSPATTDAFKALATAENSVSPDRTETLIVSAPIASVQGLSDEIAAVYPANTKPYAIAIFTKTSSMVYLEDSAESAQDTMMEMEYHVVEAMFG
jgi:hypothetical protein